MPRVALLCLLLVCGCRSGRLENLNALYDTASADLRRGEFTKSESEADRGAMLAASLHDHVFEWKFRLLRCEALLNTQRAEEVVAQLAAPMPETPPFRVLSLRKQVLQMRAAASLKRNTEADALLDTAYLNAKAAGAEDVLLDIETFQGARLLRRGRYQEAESILRRAQARARLLQSPFAEAGVEVNLGMMALTQHHYDEAASRFEDASRLATPAAQTLYSLAQSNLAICYSNLGEYDRALQIHLSSAAQHERSGAKGYLQQSLGQAGRDYMLQGELRSAVPYLQRALSIASELGNADAAIWAGNLAALYVELGDWNNAGVLNEEAIRLKISAGSRTLYYNVLNAARIAAGKGEPNQAARLYAQALDEGKDDPSVLWEAHEGLGVMAIRQQDLIGATREFEAAVDVLEKTRADLLRTEFKLPFLTRRIRLYQEYVDALLGQGQIERALAVADSSRAQVLAERSGSAPVRRLPPGAFLNLARQSGSVLLSYWLTPSQSHAWVVTPREIHHVVLPPAAEIEPLVAQFKDAIESQLADPMRTRIPAGEKLYQMLIAPVRQYVPAGARVVVVPDGALHGLNLEALPVPGETPHYWIQDVTLQIAPSLATWGGPPGPPATRRLLLLGDPTSSDPTFPPLAHAAREIAGVRQSFAPPDQVVLTRDSATPQAYLAAAAGPFAAIHFTAHAVANRENPLESAVLLSGGKLYARDVMDLPLHADLVTVSSCRGAGSRTYSGEGLVGFAWAFLRAGARHVIAGLWDVNDQSTADLMDVLYRKLAAGMRPAEALRAAKLAMIESRGNLRKPYYWAPFQLYTVAP